MARYFDSMIKIKERKEKRKRWEGRITAHENKQCNIAQKNSAKTDGTMQSIGRLYMHKGHVQLQRARYIALPNHFT